jgi:hypothetical protein
MTPAGSPNQNPVQKVIESSHAKRGIEILTAVLWGILATFALFIFGLSFFGGPAISQVLKPHAIRPSLPYDQNPGFASYRLPEAGWRTVFFGGLVYPSQIYFLEDGIRLPNRDCNMDGVISDGQGCYAINIVSDKVFFSSTDNTHPGTNGKQYEMAWRWKPSPILLVASLTALLLATLAWARLNEKVFIFLSRTRDAIVKVPAAAWIFVSLFITCLVFFLFPVFLNSARSMLQGKYIPNLDPIGLDLIVVVEQLSKPLLIEGKLYGVYPPLVAISHIPFVFMEPPDAYMAMTIITLICFIVMTVLLPALMFAGRQQYYFLLFVFAGGLFSYGFQFELERGQWNVVTMFLVLLSIWLFHKHDKYRVISYILFTIAIQFKLYPIIFIFNFIKDWRNWKENITRFVGLGLLNFAALFMLGPDSFTGFLHNLSQLGSVSIWIGDHSIYTFIYMFLAALPEDFAWMRTYSTLIENSLIVFVLLCIAFVCYQAYRRDRHGPDFILILACTACALLIPSVSHDYTLSLLVAPMAMFILADGEFSMIRKGLLPSLLIFAVSIAYSSTLYPIFYKSAFSSDLIYFAGPWADIILRNNCPALLVIVFGCACLSIFVQGPKFENNSFSNKPDLDAP